MPAPRSISELPSTSTMTPPPARSTKTGSVVPTPRATAAPRRANSSVERGPGHGGHQPALLGEPGPAGEGQVQVGNGGVGHARTRYCDGIRGGRAFGRRIPLRRPVTSIEVRHPVRRGAGRRGRARRARAGGGSGRRGRRGPGRGRRPARTRARRGAEPRVGPAGRAGRRGGPADHRRVGQAADVVAGRGGPRRGDLPVGGRGGPAVERRAAAPRHRRRRRTGGWPSYDGSPAARCWASRRSTSRSTWSPTRSRRRSRSARRSC